MIDLGRLTETDLEEIEHIARENAGEPYRDPLLALVAEVRRLREVAVCSVGWRAKADTRSGKGLR